MLKDVGCSYVIVGHSERRALYGEDDALVARKFLAAQAQGSIPILCVGETLEERERGQTTQVVVAAARLRCWTSRASARFAQAVIAYEPVWAIGTGKNATPEQAQEVHAHHPRPRSRRGMLNCRRRLRILYGGSVKAANARELFAMPDVDGGLVGGASLKADEFLKICAAAAGSLNEIKRFDELVTHCIVSSFTCCIAAVDHRRSCCCSEARAPMRAPASARARRARCSARAARRRSCRARRRCSRRCSS